MSVVDVSQIFITKMTNDDIDDVVAIEEEAYGEHHWSKSSFYDEMSNNLAHYYSAKTSDGKLVGYAGRTYYNNCGKKRLYEETYRRSNYCKNPRRLL